MFIYTGCSDSDEEEKPQSITLSVDKNDLKSNGSETVTFSVKADGKDITNNTKTRIIYKEENTQLSGNTYSTNIPGTYTFYATLDNLSSSEIQISAMPVILVLTADVTSIKTNEKSAVTFSVTADDNDVTKNVEIFFKYGESETLLEGNIFTTDQEGSYEFYSKYNDQISNIITVTAVPFVLSLKADIKSIKANGADYVTFTVTEDDEDITNEASIFCKDGEDNIQLNSNTFGTIQEGNYEFFAQYKNQTSNSVPVEAIVSRLSLTSDKTIAKTGENITFMSISDDINDVSQEVTMHITRDDIEEIIEGNVFSPQIFGTYYIYASYHGRISNTIEIEVSPAIVTLYADKTMLKSTGVDFAAFTVLADGIVVSNADIYLKEEDGDIKISDNKFSSNIQGAFSFYAQYAETKSELTEVTVSFVNFVKQSCAMEVVATWCGFSPQMINAFHEVKKLYPDQIQTVSIHRSTSDLGSSDINAEELLSRYSYEGTPFGVMDFDIILSRSAQSIYNYYAQMVNTHPVSSGIAIESKKGDNNINVTLKVKVNETNEYSVCAIIVEDSIVKQQLIYLNDSKDNSIHDNDFVHHSVATYIMPQSNLYNGKPLGTIHAGSEVTESFSIPLNKAVTEYRTVNHSNCRVVAYVLKKEAGKYYINNVTTCPVNGSVDFKYQE